MQIIEEVEIHNGAYNIRLPVGFFPQYKKHDVFFEPSLVEKTRPYSFAYNVVVNAAAGQKITYLSVPEGAVTTEIEPGCVIKVEMPASFQPPTRDLRIFYKTSDMFKPSLLAEENPAFPDKVALATLMVPTFENQKHKIEVAEEEEPEKLPI